MVQAPWVPLQAEAPRRRRVHRQSWRGGRVESLAARAALRAQGWRPRCACPGVACVVLDSAAALRAVVMPCSARQRCLCHSPRALHAPRRPPPPPPPPPCRAARAAPPAASSTQGRAGRRFRGKTDASTCSECSAPAARCPGSWLCFSLGEGGGGNGGRLGCWGPAAVARTMAYLSLRLHARQPLMAWPNMVLRSPPSRPPPRRRPRPTWHSSHPCTRDARGGDAAAATPPHPS